MIKIIHVKIKNSNKVLIEAQMLKYKYHFCTLRVHLDIIHFVHLENVYENLQMFKKKSVMNCIAASKSVYYSHSLAFRNTSSDSVLTWAAGAEAACRRLRLPLTHLPSAPPGPKCAQDRAWVELRSEMGLTHGLPSQPESLKSFSRCCWCSEECVRNLFCQLPPR